MLIIQNDLLVNACVAIQSLIDHDIVYDVIYAYHDHAFRGLHPLMYSGILVLGGRTAVYSEKPWILQEIDFMKKALESNVPILGTCLGSQLLAKSIGGKVIKGQSGLEIGYKKWNFPRMLPHPELYGTETATNPPPLKDLKLSDLGRSSSSTSLGIRRRIRFFEEESDGDADGTAMFQINKRPCDDSADDEAQSDGEGPVTTSSVEEMRRFIMMMDKDPNLGVKDIQQKLLQFLKEVEEEKETAAVSMEDSVDPFERVIYRQGMDRFIILFHGDTFELPYKCCVSKQEVRLLAATDRYRVLFKVGDWSYGFQGHPELTYDMLSVWCKCLDQFGIDDAVLEKWGGDLERDVIGYAKKHEQRILDVSKATFDIWCKEVVLKKAAERDQFFGKDASFSFVHQQRERERQRGGDRREQRESVVVGHDGVASAGGSRPPESSTDAF